MNKSNEKVIDGKRCRLFKLCVLWVCDNGWNVYRCDGDRMAGARWKNGANGHRIIHVLGHGNVRLDYMVATCFCPPCPIDGFIYTLCHKDSEPNNCCSGNLEWRRVQPVRDKMTDLLKVKIRPVGNIWLFEDGIGKATKIGDNFRKNYILVKKFVMCN